MLTLSETEARVAKGAAHLDRVLPDWFRRVDVGTLDVSGCMSCVMAQAFGVEYGVACAKAGVQFLSDWPVRDDGSRTEAQLLGFFADNTLCDWQRLQDAWIAEIARRRHPVTNDAPLVETPQPVLA